jgi:hypothetical protein
MDVSWISDQARHIHDYFQSFFYVAASLLLVIGVVTEYAKIPLGAMPGFTQLLGRTLVAIVLLEAYPEISNFITLVADEVAADVGNFNKWSDLLNATAATFKSYSWSWTSVGDSVIWLISFLAYALLYCSVFFFDAAIMFAIILLYTFSPLMIVFFILPQTASMTSGLFRTLCEVSCWKVVWSVLGTLLWSTATKSFDPANNVNFITQLALTLILTLSVLYTPMMVKAMLAGGLTQAMGQMASDSMSALSNGWLSGEKMKSLGKNGANNTQRAATKPIRMTYGAAKGFVTGKSKGDDKKNSKPSKSEPPTSKK